MIPGDPLLSIQNVSRLYQGEDSNVQALSDVSIDVASGEFLMLVGPSGCGKSTLLNIVAGLEKPDLGQVTINGKTVTGPGPDRSLVFQDGALFPWLNVQKNVEFGLAQTGVSRAERTEKAVRMLETVGLAGFERRSIHELSGGMRQRVAIARSLVLNPQVLLMDEPFSALDAITREELYAFLQDLWQDRATTVIFVTHNVREAVVLGDRVILMSPRPGRVQAQFSIDILRPRHIDDVDVARQAQKISLIMKNPEAGENLTVPRPQIHAKVRP